MLHRAVSVLCSSLCPRLSENFLYRKRSTFTTFSFEIRFRRINDITIYFKYLRTMSTSAIPIACNRSSSNDQDPALTARSLPSLFTLQRQAGGVYPRVKASRRGYLFRSSICIFMTNARLSSTIYVLRWYRRHRTVADTLVVRLRCFYLPIREIIFIPFYGVH